MFEKEALKYLFSNYGNDYHFNDEDTVKAFQKGAEYGFQKANEWHYTSEGDLPEDEGFYLLYTKEQTWILGKYEIVDGFGTWYDDTGSCEPLEDSDTVIAWKELPEPPKGIDND